MNLKQYKDASKALYADMEQVFEKHGFRLGKLNAGVDEFAGTVRLSMTLADANLRDASGNTTTPEQQRWRHHAKLLDLDPAWLGEKIILSNGHFTVAGLKETRSDKCVVIVRDDGRTFITTPLAVRQRMQARRATA